MTMFEKVEWLNRWYSSRNDNGFQELTLSEESGKYTLSQGSKIIYTNMPEEAMYWLLEGMVATFTCIDGNHDVHEGSNLDKQLKSEAKERAMRNCERRISGNELSDRDMRELNESARCHYLPMWR